MQLTLSRSIGHREAPIVKEADQRRPTLETVINSLESIALPVLLFLETLARCSGPTKASAEPAALVIQARGARARRLTHFAVESIIFSTFSTFYGSRDRQSQIALCGRLLWSSAGTHAVGF